uniref:Uncharacterized protein n=1 Tax=Clytia hemisphaerica TaxID=252671 RepID=A0A7M5U4E4_9CNID
MASAATGITQSGAQAAPPTTPAKSIRTGENRKNARKMKVLIDKCEVVKRDLFHEVFPQDPKLLYQEFKKLKPQLKQMRSQNKISAQWYFKLLPQNTDETYSDTFDSTLLDFLIIHFCPNVDPPLTGWQKRPNNTDIKRGAHCKRMSIGRNIGQHSTMYMENKLYQDAYQFIVPSLIALGVPQQEIDDLLSPLRYGFTKAVASFTGREDILKQIDQLIKQNNTKAYRVILHAAAGTGKSEIVRRYVEVYGKHFNENVIWLKSESEDSLNKAFIELAEQLNLEIRDEHQNIKSMPTIIASVYGYLDDIEPLFVFDDAWEFNVIKKFLPPYNKYTALITSQKKDFPTPDFEKIAVERLTVVESNTLLTEQCRANLTKQQIKNIDDLIQGHPLGLQ